VVCLEPSEAYAARLRELAAVHLNVRVVESTLDAYTPDPHAGFDTVVCANVLEHIPEDGEAVRKMIASLVPGGRLLLYVPAGSWAFGTVDRHLGHCRRYGARQIRALAREAGVRLQRLHHVNAIGLLGWWWAGKVARDTRIRPEKARFVDRLVPYLSAVERIVRPPFGQSIFAVIARP
jgi:SAM-dependent methyltransferase